MQYGIVITSGDPRTAADMAAEAEVAGWDGIFTYDAIAVGDGEMWDPWILLAAIAARTERIRLGALVFAPSRRRPWKLAREIITLDHLSNGRLVVPVGLGALDDAGFGNVGEPVAARTRARLLDETLAIIDGLQSGEPFAFEGEHYRSMRRALRWDGLVVQATGPDGKPATGPEVLPEIVDWVRKARTGSGLDGPFEIVVDGRTPADDPVAAAAIARAHEAAGATWWTEVDWANPSPDALRARIQAGPPRG
jgi:hypothetical protein